jgi:hypothetical protein
MTVEQRRHTTDELQVRVSTSEPSSSFHGYATSYDYWYDVAGGPTGGGWRELVAQRAGAKT